MRLSIGSIAICIFLTVNVFPQEQTRVPFADLDLEVRAQHGGWAGNKRILSAVFDDERKRLGDRFESELLKYIADDAEKHYWISAFLEEPTYLHGSKPLPYLSLLIKQQGLSLLRGKRDEKSIGSTFSLNVTAAVLSQRLGLSSLAVFHKNEAERLRSKNSSMYAYFPAMTEDEIRTYENLKSQIPSPLPDEAFRDKPETRVISGSPLNERATRLPMPVYPVTAPRIAGRVIVAVVFDEAGNVIWARATSGPKTLRRAAEEAAFKAQFKPFMLDGKAEKVTGVIHYDFAKR